MYLEHKNRPSETPPVHRLPIAPFVAALAGGALLNALTQLDARVYAVPIAVLGAFALGVIAVAVWKCASALAGTFANSHSLLTVITRGGVENAPLSASPSSAHSARRWVKAAKPTRRLRVAIAVRR